MVMVLLLAQIWSPTSPPKLLHVWSLVLAALAMPLFFVVAVFDQLWASWQLSYADLHRITKVNKARACAWYSAGFFLVASIACLLFSLSSVAAVVFLACGFIAVPGGFFAFAYAAVTANRAAMQIGEKSPPVL